MEDRRQTREEREEERRRNLMEQRREEARRKREDEEQLRLREHEMRREFQTEKQREKKEISALEKELQRERSERASAEKKKNQEIARLQAELAMLRGTPARSPSVYSSGPPSVMPTPVDPSPHPSRGSRQQVAEDLVRSLLGATLHSLDMGKLELYSFKFLMSNVPTKVYTVRCNAVMLNPSNITANIWNSSFF